ncbi:MAG: magnesium chelatase, partial [Bacteroidota bacterium]
RAITKQEARLKDEQREMVEVPDMLEILLEQLSFAARDSEYIDEKSGVSARLGISAYENLVSTSERRALLNNEGSTTARITDFWGVVPAITGKVELVYEGEQEGAYGVAINLLGKAIQESFLAHFPDPRQIEQGVDKDPYGTIRAFFGSGKVVDILNDDATAEYQKKLDGIAGLGKLVDQQIDSKLTKGERYLYMELALQGLTELGIIHKDVLENSLSFRDLLADMLGDDDY